MQIQNLTDRWGNKQASMKISLLRLFIGGLFGLILVMSMNTSLRAAVRAVSLGDPAIAPADRGNGDSSGSIINTDGRFVLFLSSANNLATNDENGKFVDVFVRNRANNTTTLVSVSRTGAGGGNG